MAFYGSRVTILACVMLYMTTITTLCKADCCEFCQEENSHYEFIFPENDPPFSRVDYDSSTLKGFSADFMRRACDDTTSDCTDVYNWGFYSDECWNETTSRSPALDENTGTCSNCAYKACVGMMKTTEREKLYDFVAFPYAGIKKTRIYVSSNNISYYYLLSSLSTVKIGIHYGFEDTYQCVNRELDVNITTGQLNGYSNYTKMASDLEAGVIDVMLADSDYFTLDENIKLSSLFSSNIECSTGGMGVMVNKNDSCKFQWLQDALTSYLSNKNFDQMCNDNYMSFNSTTGVCSVDGACYPYPCPIGEQVCFTIGSSWPWYFCGSPCGSNTCVDGNCVNQENSTCECDPGYGGSNCTIEISDDCASIPCIRGECYNTIEGAKCNCSGILPPYTGDLCEIKVCDRHPWIHGTCNKTANNTLTCDCDAGYIGTFCNIANQCNSQPCFHGICSETQNDTCLCNAGYMGPACDIHNCTENCSTHGNCTNTGNGLVCDCDQGYFGDLCNETAPCERNAWIHGTCTATGSDLSCVCDPGAGGPLCIGMTCQDWYDQGDTLAGTQTITPGADREPIEAWCDQGWTVILSREWSAHRVVFDNSWDMYKVGFGIPNTEHWIGNEAIHYMTRDQPRKLKVFHENFNIEGEEGEIMYDSFSISDEANCYRLNVSGVNFSSVKTRAVDTLTNTTFPGLANNGMCFSTRDRDNDLATTTDCAEKFLGGWWYSRCSLGYPTAPSLEMDETCHHEKCMTWFVLMDATTITMSIK